MTNSYQRHVNKIGTRQILFMGGDRELMQSVIGLCLLITIPAFSIKGCIIAGVIWFTTSYFLKKLAVHDELIRQVYFPFVQKYTSYYPAISKRYRKG